MPDVTNTTNVQALLYGELLAEAASAALADRMPSARMRHAYRRQAEDEARHAHLFREYLHRIGAGAVERPDLPELGAYERMMKRAVDAGHLLTLVLATNVALEAMACVGMAASARWVEATGDAPAWVSLMRRIEEDERRHTRLALPALRALGGGVVPAEAREVLGEVREAAVETLSALGADLVRWGIDPVVLFDAALSDVHPALSPVLLGR